MRSSFEPLKISFFLRTPLVLGWPWIHFDSLIAHTILRRELGSKYYTLPSKKLEEKAVEVFRSEMPILRTRHNGLELYHASVSFFEEKVVGGVTIYKKFHTRAIGLTKSKKRRVEITRGHFKAFAMRMPLVVTRRVDFFVLGDEGELEELVKHIPALGKKRVYGFGDIKKFTIEKIDRDSSLISEEGVVMRPIPVRAFKKIKISENVSVGVVGYRPPYWWKSNGETCILPGGRLGDYQL